MLLGKTNTIFEMNIYKTLVFLLFLAPQISMAQSEYEIKEAAIINQQKDIVGKLTGELPIKGKKILTSRASVSERKLAGDFLFEELKSAGLEVERNSYTVQDQKGNKYAGSNIFAEIPATNGSDEWVIISAHYDTLEGTPGAVHNATGIAIACYVAEKIAKLEVRNKNFMIVLFDQWTQNLIGTRMFIQKLKKDRYNIHSMHRADYMGWDTDEDRAIEIYASNISLESMYRNESPVPIYKRMVATPETRFFSNFGFNAATITAELKNSENSPFTNQENDKYTTVNFKYLASTTDIVFNVMKTLAEE